MRSKKRKEKEKKKDKKKSEKNLLENKLPKLDFENLMKEGITLGTVKSLEEVERIVNLNKRITEENGENISIVINTPGINDESLKLLKEEKNKENDVNEPLYEPEYDFEDEDIQYENEYQKNYQYDDDIYNVLSDDENEKNFKPEEEPLVEIEEDEKTELLFKPQHKKISCYFTLKDGQRININRKVFRIGRNSQYNDYVLTNKKISGKHAEIIVKNGKVYIKDLNSTNGIFLEGVKIPQGAEVEIKEGQEIILANEVMVMGKA